jgi:hypothetical protein
MVVALLFIPDTSIAGLTPFILQMITAGTFCYVLPLAAAMALTTSGAPFADLGVDSEVVFLAMLAAAIVSAVDSALHVAYGFHVARQREDQACEKPADMIDDALGRLGWPIVQVPSGCLTLIVGTQNWWFLAKYRGDPRRTSS